MLITRCGTRNDSVPRRSRKAEITIHANRGHGGCAVTIVLPESQHAFDYAAIITRKHGVLMTVFEYHPQFHH
jgi:hypothetical protein